MTKRQKCFTCAIVAFIVVLVVGFVALGPARQGDNPQADFAWDRKASPKTNPSANLVWDRPTEPTGPTAAGPMLPSDFAWD